MRRNQHDADPPTPILRRPAPFRRGLRNLLILGLPSLVFVELFGLPHLRIEYRYVGSASNPSIIDTDYWSVTGMRHVGWVEVDDRLSLVKLLPLETPLREQGAEMARRLWSRAMDQIGEWEREARS